MRPIAKPENEREEETRKKLSSVTPQVEVLQKANISSARQEIPPILRKPNVQYRVQNGPLS